MKTKPIFLASVATAALLGGLALATPLSAQYAGNPPQYSSPAEKAQTQQLNEQGVNGTTEPPAVLNGEAQDIQAPQQAPTNGQSGYYGGYPDNDSGDATSQPGNSQQPTTPSWGQSAPGNAGAAPSGSAYPSPQPDPHAGYSAYYGGQDDQQVAQASPSNQQQQYNQQVQQYQDQQQQYQDQKAQYEDQNNHYQHELRWYDQARWNYEYPRPYAYEYDEGGRLVRLIMIAEPTQQLHDVPVEGPNGVWVGRIRNVEIGPDGTPMRIEVALNRRVSVWLRPGSLRFDPSEHVAFTNMTREDLWQMPGATIESSPM